MDLQYLLLKIVKICKKAKTIRKKKFQHISAIQHNFRKKCIFALSKNPKQCPEENPHVKS